MNIRTLVVDDERLLLIAGSNGLGIRTVVSAFLPRGGGQRGGDCPDTVEEGG